jgi:hypothetical protein
LHVLERAYALAEENLRRDADDASGRSYLATVGIVYAGILRHSDPRRALAVYDEALTGISQNRDNPRSRRQEVRLLAGSSYPLRSLGRKAEARKRIDAALERLGHLKLYPAEQIRPGSEADEALSALADYEAEQKIPEHAVEIYDQLLLKVAASKPEPDTSLGDAFHLSRLYGALAGMCRRAHQDDRAASEEGRRLELWKRWDARLPHNTFVRRQLAAASGAATWVPAAARQAE